MLACVLFICYKRTPKGFTKFTTVLEVRDRNFANFVNIIINISSGNNDDDETQGFQDVKLYLARDIPPVHSSVSLLTRRCLYSIQRHAILIQIACQTTVIM